MEQFNTTRTYDKATTCCFAGHRPYRFSFLPGQEKSFYKNLKANIENSIISSYKEGYRTFICGGTIGFDIMCSQAVLRLKRAYRDIKLVCFLPFEGHYEEFPSEWKSRFLKVLHSCDFIEYTSPEYAHGCYYDRNQKMIDVSSRIIAYFDGKGGGTANTIAMAQLNKLEIINLCADIPVPEHVTFYTGHRNSPGEVLETTASIKKKNKKRIKPFFR